MSTIFKFIFELAIDPLGLPINALLEYFILAIVGEIAFRITFRHVGDLYDSGLIHGSTIGSFLHWSFRFLTYAFIWIVLRAVIWFYRFVLAHWIAVIIAVCVLAAVSICCVVAFKYYKKNKKNYISL